MSKEVKVGAAYNVWGDSLELLLGSIQCLRPSVDYIVVVYSVVSNFGQEDWYTMKYVQALEMSGIIDEAIEYWPSHSFEHSTTVQCQQNETIKRRRGIDALKEAGCTHAMVMDSDEYYYKRDLSGFIYRLKEGMSMYDQRKIEDGNFNFLKLYKMSEVIIHSRIITYYKSPELSFYNYDSYEVVLMFPLDDDLKIGTEGGSLYKTSPFFVDPTRYITSDRGRILSEQTMHHFSYVRTDINLKLDNSTARANLKSQKSLILEEYKKARPGSVISTYHGRKLHKTEDYFNVKDHIARYERAKYKYGS